MFVVLSNLIILWTSFNAFQLIFYLPLHQDLHPHTQSSIAHPVSSKCTLIAFLWKLTPSTGVSDVQGGFLLMVLNEGASSPSEGTGIWVGSKRQWCPTILFSIGKSGKTGGGSLLVWILDTSQLLGGATEPQVCVMPVCMCVCACILFSFSFSFFPSTYCVKFNNLIKGFILSSEQWSRCWA